VPRALRSYVAWIAALNLAWEIAQLPFYTLWTQATAFALAWAVIHCTAADIAIAAAMVSLAVVLAGGDRWPRERFAPVAVLSIGVGLGWTVYSEWLNVVVRGEWAYASSMPTLAPLGTGLTPLLQWLVVPMIAFWRVHAAIRT
jgi:hypothetical protein